MAWLRAWWHWILTAVVFAVGVAVAASFSLNEAGNIGDYLAGFSAALAFIWLIAALRLQSQELALQREELALQRQAIQDQTAELKTSAAMASLAQIATLLEQARRRVGESELGVNTPDEVSTLWLQSIGRWKIILESTDSQAVFDAYGKWLPVEALVRKYVGTVAAALRIYLEHHQHVKTESVPDEQLIIGNEALLRAAPYFSEHAGAVHMAAHHLYQFRPGLKAVTYAGMVSSVGVTGAPDILKEGAREKARSELAELNAPIPAIDKVV